MGIQAYMQCAAQAGRRVQLRRRMSVRECVCEGRWACDAGRQMCGMRACGQMGGRVVRHVSRHVCTSWSLLLLLPSPSHCGCHRRCIVAAHRHGCCHRRYCRAIATAVAVDVSTAATIKARSAKNNIKTTHHYD